MQVSDSLVLDLMLYSAHPVFLVNHFYYLATTLTPQVKTGLKLSALD